MYLGLDLRGGVHFMLQVDMPAALQRRADVLAGDLRTALREKNVRHGGIQRNGRPSSCGPRRSHAAQAIENLVTDQFPDLQLVRAAEGAEFRLTATLKPRGGAPRCRSRRSSRTSPRCTTASTNWAWPSR
jgi:preprotein translocase subunit SecD